MPFEADLIIAQSLQSTDGGVSALGMGWQVRDPEPVPWALVLLIHASRDLIGTEHAAQVRLEKADGSEVDETLIEMTGVDLEFVPEGITEAGLTSPVVRGYGFNLFPVPLEPGTEFLFRLWVDGETRDHWVAHFRTSPP
jgi:hypothetical protein